MGLLEKLKNTFFEEEYVEVDEVDHSVRKKAKKEVNPVAKKIENVERHEDIREVEEVSSTKEFASLASDLEIESQADTELLKSEVEIPYFEDEDFVESVPETIEVPKEETKTLYGGDPSLIYHHVEMESSEFEGKPYSSAKEGKSSFKPTPIISPIYGILDKNYRKEEVVDKKDKPSSYVSRRNVDLDFVRNKAFGSLEDDLVSIGEKQRLGYSEFSENEEYEGNLLYDMTDAEETPSVDKVTLADAEEYFEDLGLEYNIDYKDVRHEKVTGRRSRVTKKEVADSESPARVSKTEVEEVPFRGDFEDSRYEMNQESVDDRLEDNLFDLVDSMYEERE